MQTKIKEPLSKEGNHRFGTPLLLAMSFIFYGSSVVGGISVHSSGRYYQDAAGKPMFLIGYYGWAAVPDGYYIDHPSRYMEMVDKGAQDTPVYNKINYIRISLGVNRFTTATDPPVYYGGSPTPVPFLYVNDKADLNQWDPVFWNGLKAQVQNASDHGVIAHIAIFDAVELRQCCWVAYGYGNSFWNPSNHYSTYYPAGDYSDYPGAFYRLAEFNNNTDIGKYQRMLIDKVTSELAGYDNVMYEVGNEMGGSDSAWNTAVISYISTKTTAPVTQCGGAKASNLQGWGQHEAVNPAQYKINVAAIVGLGYPAWEDPDNNDYYNNGDDGYRRAAWYSFVGGAAAFGGFSVDFWDWWGVTRGFTQSLCDYYNNLQSFVEDSGITFWEMTPQHYLVSNDSENSCLAKIGYEYVVYVLNDSSVNLDLTTLIGDAHYRLYDPVTNVWSSQQTVSGGGVRTFNKPAGADDWVVYIGEGGGATVDWNTMGTITTIGSGHTPSMAVDSSGNIHVAYVTGSGVQYKKYNSLGTLLTSESITSPSGSAYWLNMALDSNDVPHLVFSESVSPDMPYASFAYYANRIDGSWKSPITAVNCSGTGNIWNHRLALWGNYAYIGCQYGYAGNLVGRIDRVTNLSGTPTTDKTVTTATRSCIAITSNGNLYALGRNDGVNTACQQYDTDLTTVGGLQSISNGTGKPGAPAALWADKNNVTHMVAWGIEAGGAGVCADRCGMIYNSTARQNGDGSYQNPILGLLGGPAGTGPDGNEPTGWWNDDVSPAVAVDAANIVYVAWRGWTAVGEGRITKVDDSGFTQTCTPEPTCGSNICTGTQFCPTITRRRWWNCEIAPAKTGGVYVAWDYNDVCYFRPVGVASVSMSGVSIDLGSPDIQKGMTHPQNDDGDTTPVTIGDRTCRRNVNQNEDFYFYFGVSDAFAFRGSRPELYITIDYFDTGSGSLELHYDSPGDQLSDKYKEGGSVALTGTDTWKKHSYHITDAYFGNRQNAGADFRIFGGVGNIFYLDMVEVFAPPEIKLSITSLEHTVQICEKPSNDGFAVTNIGGGMLDYTITDDATWLSVSPESGTGSGEADLINITYDAVVLAAGDYSAVITVEDADALNSPQTIVVDLHVFIPGDFDGDADVDQEDFGHLQECFSGSGLVYAEGCQGADFNDDLDVDLDDFAAFQSRMTGANQTPGCSR